MAFSPRKNKHSAERRGEELAATKRKKNTMYLEVFLMPFLLAFSSSLALSHSDYVWLSSHLPTSFFRVRVFFCASTHICTRRPCFSSRFMEEQISAFCRDVLSRSLCPYLKIILSEFLLLRAARGVVFPRRRNGCNGFMCNLLLSLLNFVHFLVDSHPRHQWGSENAVWRRRRRRQRRRNVVEVKNIEQITHSHTYTHVKWRHCRRPNSFQVFVLVLFFLFLQSVFIFFLRLWVLSSSSTAFPSPESYENWLKDGKI